MVECEGDYNTFTTVCIHYICIYIDIMIFAEIIIQ